VQIDAGGWFYPWTVGPSLGTPSGSTGTWSLYAYGVIGAQAFFSTSDERFKTNIEPLSNSLDKILKLNGKSYNWNVEQYPGRGFNKADQIGFLAQELGTVVPQSILKDQDGYLSVNYNMLIPVLTEAIKELNAKVDATTQENANLKAQLNDICSNGCASLKGTGANSTAPNQLLQNVPNPFSNDTKIGYVLNTGTAAYINVNTLDGKVIKHINLSMGSGSVTISGSDLSAGTYTYSLYVDNNVIDTKIMVITSQE